MWNSFQPINSFDANATVFQNGVHGDANAFLPQLQNFRLEPQQFEMMVPFPGYQQQVAQFAPQPFVQVWSPQFSSPPTSPPLLKSPKEKRNLEEKVVIEHSLERAEAPRSPTPTPPPQPERVSHFFSVYIPNADIVAFVPYRFLCTSKSQWRKLLRSAFLSKLKRFPTRLRTDMRVHSTLIIV